jgi:hypothetical protein
MQWITPCDPECPEVAEYMESLYGDPMSIAMGAPLREIAEEWEKKHRVNCKRCQEYGAANIDVG